MGTAAVTKPAANPLENIRPELFLDAILIHNIAGDGIVSLTNSSVTTMDTKNKQLIETPQYDLTVLDPGSSNKAQGKDPSKGPSKDPGQDPGQAPVQVFLARRVIKFSRVDLLPAEQDIYNKDGDMETQITYGPYQTYNGTPYPSTITIERPLEEFRLAVTVHEVKFNLSLPDGQFEQKVPSGYKVEKLQ